MVKAGSGRITFAQAVWVMGRQWRVVVLSGCDFRSPRDDDEAMRGQSFKCEFFSNAIVPGDGAENVRLLSRHETTSRGTPKFPHELSKFYTVQETNSLLCILREFACRFQQKHPFNLGRIFLKYSSYVLQNQL